MRYEDASGAFQASGPIANDDADTLAAGSRGPATGNLITGEGTQYGAAGADSAAGAHITAIGGQGGEDSSFAGGKLSIAGAYGQLSVDAEGNYIYMANKGAPENVRDRFTYTLADNQGNSDTGALIVEIGKTPAVIKADAQQIVPGPDGVVTLPPGVELSDIMVVGRNLVVNMPDGTQLIIVDGAVFVPQLVLGGVEVPATNVATLLIGQEPQPAAGETPPSSGGNFAVPPPPLDPGVPLGDLIPPTEYNYQPPEPQEVFPIEDSEPEIFVQPDGQPASVNAVDQVDEAGLPERDGNLLDEPAGSGESADGNGADNDVTSEATGGTIIYNSPDGVDSITINGVEVVAVGQVIQGEFGTLEITSIAPGAIGYLYTLTDNTSGDTTHDDFAVSLTDPDGDVANATLVIDIIDDVPTARNDTDAVVKGDTSTDGNVMTAVGTTNSPAGADTVGADDATLTGIHAGTSGSFTAVPGAGVTVVGTFGDLHINPDGSYTYTLHAEVGNGGTDVFTYQLTDGDSDTSNATLTITVPPDLKPVVGPNPDVIVDDDAFAGGNPGGTGDDPNAVNVSGTLSGSGGDGPLTFAVQLTGAPAGFTYVSGGAGIVLIQQGGNTVLTVTVDSDGSYTVVQNAVIDHAAGGDENNQPFTINYTVTDVDGDSANGSVTISVDDDTPLANNDTDTIPVGEFGPAVGNVITGEGTVEGTANADSPGADGFNAIVGLSSNNVPANVDNDASGGFVVDGQYGTLTMQDDGSYSYVRDPGPGGVSDVFTYTYVDNDGDTVSATLTIDIPDTPIIMTFGNAVGLDDDALANGNPGGPGDDDPDTANTVGDLNIQGGDGQLTFELLDTSTGAPDGFTYQLQGNGDLWILQGSTHVLTITLDSATGHYTVTQEAPIDHPSLNGEAGDNTENNLTFPVSVQVTDEDGDSVTAVGQIIVDDDSPVIANLVTEGNVALDESDAGSPAGFPISDTSDLPVIDFDALFGADGAAAVNSTVLGLAITGGPGSGLKTAVGDFDITLVQIDGDTIEGHYNGSNVAFIIQMNGDGTVTLTQNVALEHNVDGGTPADYNDTLDLGGLIAATVTITDGDGDTTSEQVGIGDGLVFFDDGPNAVNDTDTVGAPGSTATGNVITDAAAGDAGDGDNGADDPGADAPATITNLVSVNEPGNTDQDPAAGVFEIQGQYGVLVMNADGSYTYTRDAGTPGGVQDVFTYTLTDADGDFDTATLTITLGDATPTAGNVDVQLDDDALANGNPGGTGDDADAVNVSGDLPGSGGDAPLTFAVLTTGEPAGFDYVSGGAGIVLIQQGGETKLTVTVNSDGSYTVVQNNPIEHPDGLAENNVEFVVNYTVTDSDNDVANGTITINVDDDTPTATATQLTGTVDEDGVLEGAADNGVGDGIAGGTGDVAGQAVSATGNVSGLFASGADTPLTYQLLANFAGLNAQNLTSGGVALTYDVAFAAGVYTLTASAGVGGDTVFTFTLNATTGAYNFTLVDQLDHVSGNNENDLAVNLSSIIQATDNDADSVTAGANGLIITVDDDTPIATNVQLTGTVDEDGVIENGAVGIQYGDGIPGGTGDVAGEVVSATGNVSTLFQSGADEALSFQLLNNFAGLNAQSLTSGGVALTYSVQLAAGVYTLTATAGNGGPVVFTFTLNATSGDYNFTLVDQLDHPTLNGVAGDNTENDLPINLSSIIQATDHDGDSVAAGSNGLIITVDDDMPVINTVTDAQIDNDANPSGGGTFDFDIGADENSDHDDITVSSFAVSVNGVALDPADFTLTPGSETALVANYTFSFTYDTGTGGETTANGTLVFDKIAGTYTVELTNGPIEGFSLLSTGAADASDFVSYQVPNGGSGAPEVTVAALDTDFFVQFSGVAEPGSGTGADNLTTTQGVGNTFVPTTGSFANLELFTQEMSTIQVSNAAAGVAGNTIQGGEVLDLNLYATDPGGTLGGVPTQSSTSMFMTLDGIGTSEDMIVVLKLLDTNTGQYTTKAIIVQNGDILTDADAASLVGTAYEGLGAALDNNDGLIVIEANDYQEGNTNLVIVGAQIAGSDEGISGTGIDLNGAVDSDTVDGSSSGTQAFSTDASDAPFKVTSIGFLTTTTEDQNATIDFDVTVEDADGDAVSEHVTVQIGAPVSPMPVPFLADSSNQTQQLQKTAANSDTLTMAAAVAAAGLTDSVAAAPQHDGQHHNQDSDLTSGQVAQTVDHYSVDDDGSSAEVSQLAPEQQADNSAPADSSSSSSDDSSSSHSVDDSSAPAAPEASEHGSSGDEAPAQAAADASPVAPTVAMVSAEALQEAAAGVDGGHAKHGGAVEQVVADALGHADAPTVDAVLANLPAGNGGLQAIAHMASPAADNVSAWDMGGHGHGAAIHDMMLSMHAANMHHDAVQPAVNG